MWSSMAILPSRVRFAITEEPVGPAFSSRYTADLFLSGFSITTLGGLACVGWSFPHAFTAGCSSRSVSAASMAAYSGISLTPRRRQDRTADTGHPPDCEGGSHEAPIFQLQPQVAVAQRTQPVGDDEGRTPLHEALHGLHDDGFGFQIDRTGRLVQKKNRGIL